MNGSTFKHKLKFWTPDSPKKNQYDYDIWDGDEKNVLFNYPYFTAHFMKMDLRLVPDGSAVGISELRSEGQSEKVTTLDGRTVERSSGLRKGIYIIDGKKHVLR